MPMNIKPFSPSVLGMIHFKRSAWVKLRKVRLLGIFPMTMSKSFVVHERPIR